MKTSAILLLSILLASHAVGQDAPKPKTRNANWSLPRAIARLAAQGGSDLIRSDVSRAKLPKRVAEWLTDNQAALVGVSGSPFQTQLKWGVATVQNDVLYLHVMQWPEDGKLLIPRLHNSVNSVTLNSQSGELKLTPNVQDWSIALPEKPKQRQTLLPIVKIQLDSAPVQAHETAPTVQPGDDGRVLLHSRYAIVHGKMLRFEPQPHKNTVGYWVEEGDWAEWAAMVPAEAEYQVQLRYGCGKGNGGSQIKIEVGESQLTFDVEETGGFQNWREVNVGNVKLKAGKNTLKVTPILKAKNAVMDIQQIILRPTA